MSDKLIKLLPLLTVLIILTSLFNLTIHYSFFGIKVIDYIEWTEIITLVSEDIIQFAMILSFAFLIVLSKRISYILGFDTFTYWIILALLAMILMSTSVYITQKTNQWMFFVEMALASFFVFFLKLIYELRLKRNNSIHEVTFYVLGIFVIFNCFMFYSTLLKADGLIKNLKQRNTTLLIDSIVIPPYDSVYYIGKTKNYVFIYDSKSHETSVYKVEQVKKIIVQKR